MRLTATDPQTRQETVRYVGRYDAEPATLTLSDGCREPINTVRVVAALKD